MKARPDSKKESSADSKKKEAPQKAGPGKQQEVPSFSLHKILTAEGWKRAMMGKTKEAKPPAKKG